VPLSEDLRNELAAIAPRRGCDRLAELSGLFHTAGSLHLRGRGEVALHLDLASPAVARRAFALLRGFRIAAEIRTYPRRAFGRETRYQVHVEGMDRALQVLHEAGVVSAGLAPLERPPKRVVARPCCARAYLRGALLGSGSLSGPRSPHLEVRAASRVGAELIASLAGAAGARMAVLERGRHAVAYAKGVDVIAGAIAAAGASDTALAFQERAVVGATKARANRLANADHANLVRTSKAAKAQIRAIRKLEKRRHLADLPEPLREIARLRLRHPGLSLRDLGAHCSPPATKASAQRRLAKIVRLAEL
jgi:cell division protein WhiA